MQSLESAVDRVAVRKGFSGVVRVDRPQAVEFRAAYGFADRAYGVANTVDTSFAIASGTKALTALTVMRLVEQGVFTLGTPVRGLLGQDLPMVGPDVTIEHLLAHRSGIGDYLDEETITDIRDYLMPVPVHQLATTEQYLPLLADKPSVFAPGERFAYSNAGYVLLALITERATGTAFHDLVDDLVCEPAGMAGTAFLRSDELPGTAARGYLSETGLRTNVLHLPVLGSGDGGAYATAADLASLWSALFAGRIVSSDSLAQMLRPRSDWPEESRRYGLGFHLHATGAGIFVEGYDAGVSFRSGHEPATSTTYTVMSNWTDGAWPIVDLLVALLEDRLGR